MKIEFKQVLLAFFLFSATTANAALVTYKIDFTVADRDPRSSDPRVTGYITTNGAMGSDFFPNAITSYEFNISGLDGSDAGFNQTPFVSGNDSGFITWSGFGEIFNVSPSQFNLSCGLGESVRFSEGSKYLKIDCRGEYSFDLYLLDDSVTGLSKFESDSYYPNAFSLGSPVPLPAAVWLFGTALLGLAGLNCRRRQTVSSSRKLWSQ